jgi:hypothetical protein
VAALRRAVRGGRGGGRRTALAVFAWAPDLRDEPPAEKDGGSNGAPLPPSFFQRDEQSARGLVRALRAAGLAVSVAVPDSSDGARVAALERALGGGGGSVRRFPAAALPGAEAAAGFGTPLPTKGYDVVVFVLGDPAGAEHAAGARVDGGTPETSFWRPWLQAARAGAAAGSWVGVYSDEVWWLRERALCDASADRCLLQLGATWAEASHAIARAAEHATYASAAFVLTSSALVAEYARGFSAHAHLLRPAGTRAHEPELAAAARRGWAERTGVVLMGDASAGDLLDAARFLMSLSIGDGYRAIQAPLSRSLGGAANASECGCAGPTTITVDVVGPVAAAMQGLPSMVNAAARLQEAGVLVRFVPEPDGAQLARILDTARVMAVPSAFSSAPRREALLAAERGLPVVASVVGAAALLRAPADGRRRGATASGALACDGALEFLLCVANVYSDRELWEALSFDGLQHAYRTVHAAGRDLDTLDFLAQTVARVSDSDSISDSSSSSSNSDVEVGAGGASAGDSAAETAAATQEPAP